MDRKQAFKRAKSLIKGASVLYALRDYDLKNSINFPLGNGRAQIIKSKKKDIAQNFAVEALKAKKDRDLRVKLKLEIQRYNNEELQQVANCIMRIFRVSIVKKVNEAITDEDKKMRQINAIGKTNNACIYLLEGCSKEILDRALGSDDYEILEGLSTRMLSYLTAVIRRYMISHNMDHIMDRYKSNQLSPYEEIFLTTINRHQSLLEQVIKLLKSRGVNQIEQQIKIAENDVKEFMHSGYSNLF